MVPYIGIDVLRGERWSVYLTDCSATMSSNVGLMWRLTVKVWLDDVCEQWTVAVVGATPNELLVSMRARLNKAIGELDAAVVESWCDKYPHAEYGFTPPMPVIDWAMVDSALFALVGVEDMTEVAVNRKGPQVWHHPDF